MDLARIAHGIGAEEKQIKKVISYIDNYWPKLIREHKKDLKSLIGLPNPYIVPTDAGDVFQEQYYWDSYVIIRGLIHDPKYTKLCIGMVENFFYLLDRFGIIPNASRFHFLSRSQPPLLSSLVWLVYMVTQDKKWFKKGMQYVEYEYEKVWMGTTHLANFRLTDIGLCRYYDINALDSLAEAESGWDMTMRFNEKCLDYVPVDLNCLLYLYEKDMEQGNKILKSSEKAAKYKKAADLRAKQINDYLWDDKRGYYFDYNFVKHQRSHLVTVAGVYPMNVGLASHRKATHSVEMIKRELEQKWGIVQTVRFVKNLQWDWPNGWPPLQLRVVEAMLRYGQISFAKRLVTKWLSLNLKVFNETGMLWEKYDVVRGRVGVPDRYPTPYGFAWTNSVFLAFLEIYEYLENHPHEGAMPVWLIRRRGWV